jgi:hypothetical protein
VPDGATAALSILAVPPCSSTVLVHRLVLARRIGAAR